MVSNKRNWVEIIRMATAPLCFLIALLLSILTWIYTTDRHDNKEFQQNISSEIRQGFKEIAQEFKNIRQDNAMTKVQVEAKLGFISGACCSEVRDKQSILTSDTITY